MTLLTGRALRKAASGALFLGLTIGLTLPAYAVPPGGKPTQAKKPDSPPGNPNCAKDNGKASPKKADPKGFACGQKNNPPHN